MRKEVKFEINDLLPIGLTFVVLGIGLAYGLSVMGDVRTDFMGAKGCNATSTARCSAEYNATTDAIDGVAKFPEKMPLIATVVIAAIIIGILVRYLMKSFT